MYDFSLFLSKMVFALKLVRFKEIIAFCRFYQMHLTPPHALGKSWTIFFHISCKKQNEKTKQNKKPKQTIKTIRKKTNDELLNG